MSLSSPEVPAGIVRWPAEWEPHAGTWLAWPHNRRTWPDDVEALECAFHDAILALTTSEPVHVAVADEPTLARVRARFAAVDGAAWHPPNLRLHLLPTDDAWCRDYGPVCVRWGAGVAAVDFRFNAWGGKYPACALDDAAGAKMAAAVGVPCLTSEFVLEGGSIDGNGAGLVATTEQCLLNPNRNPDMSLLEIEQTLQRWLGGRDIIWLGGGVVGDDTDGHVDNLARFVAPDTMLVLTEPDPLDANYEALEDNLERARGYRGPRGERLTVLPVAAPEPLFHQGRRLPASYVNFYIGNRVVLVPQFGGARDAAALACIARCFPDRRAVGVDSRVVVRGNGGWHCLTQQIGAA